MVLKQDFAEHKCLHEIRAKWEEDCEMGDESGRKCWKVIVASNFGMDAKCQTKNKKQAIDLQKALSINLLLIDFQSRSGTGANWNQCKMRRRLPVDRWIWPERGCSLCECQCLTATEYQTTCCYCLLMILEIYRWKRMKTMPDHDPSSNCL